MAWVYGFGLEILGLSVCLRVPLGNPRGQQANVQVVSVPKIGLGFTVLVGFKLLLMAV